MNPAGSGYFPLRRVKLLGANVFVHWSAVAVAGLMFGAWHRQPGLALEAIACYFGLILLHEAGHAAMARRLGCPATEIRLSAVHGLCVHDTPDTLRDEALVAWGGVLAQLVVALPLLALQQAFGIASLPYAGIPIAAFGYYSVLLAAYNLVPVRPLDGARAWKLLPVLVAGLRARGNAMSATNRLLSRSAQGARGPAASRPRAVPTDGPDSARWLALACARMASARAGWPEIANELNPRHDRVVGELIQRVRASHMGAPLQGLQLMEAACHVALEEHAHASGVDALTSAVDSLGTLEKARW